MNVNIQLSMSAVRHILDTSSLDLTTDRSGRPTLVGTPSISPPTPLPSRDEGISLHARLLAGDPTASSDLCTVYLPYLVRYLRRHFPETDESLIVDAVHQTLIDLIQRPTIFDPIRAGLQGFLQMSARRDLLNEIDRATRYGGRTVSIETLAEAGTQIPDREDPFAALLEEPGPDPIPTQVHVSLSPTERAVFDLMAEGERRTEMYARALGLLDLPPPEQRRAVKRVKDRITKRLERAR